MKILTKSRSVRNWLVVSFGLFVSVATFIYISLESKIFASLKTAQYDDIYITYRYVQNLQLGNGLRFNAGDTTNSSTSFLYTVLIHFISSVTNFNIPTVGIVIGILSLSLSAGVVAIYSLARSFTILGAFVGAASAVTLVSNPTLLYWACSGMETTLFLLLMLLAISLTYLMIRNSLKSNLITALTTLSLLGLSLVRWEGAILAVLLSVYIVISASRIPSQNHSTKWLVRVLPLLSSVLAITSLLAFYRLYYGHFLPDSISFKKISDYYTQSPIEIVSTIYLFMKSRLEIIFLLLVLAGFLTPLFIGRSKIKKFNFYAEVVPGLGMVGSVTVIIFGAYADEFRYIAPLVGIAALLLTQLADFSVIFSKRYTNVINLLVVCIIAMSTFVSISSGIALSEGIKNGMQYQYLEFSRIEMGRWIEKNLPRDSVILSEDIGALSYYSPSMRYFDASGLTNHKLLAELHLGEDYSSIVAKAAPQYLVGTTDKNLLTGSEWIFDNPAKYFDPKAISVHSDCSFEETFVKRKLYQLPHKENVPLSVTLWKLSPKGGCEFVKKN